MSVEQNLEQILAARYGKDVRQSIHDAIYDINEVAKNAEYHAETAPESAKNYALLAYTYEQQARQAQYAAQQAATQAMSGTPTGYEQVVEEVRSLKKVEDSLLSETGTYTGRVLLDKIYGMSFQPGIPTPSVPVAINSAKANFANVGKNIIPYPYYRESGRVVSGLTFTYDTYGKITVNGTKEANSVLYGILNMSQTSLTQLTTKLLQSASWKLSIEANKSVSDFNVTIEYRTSANNVISTQICALTNQTYNEIALSVPDNTAKVNVWIEDTATTGATRSNLIVKPMISIEGSDFLPYQAQSIVTNLVIRANEVSSTDDYNLFYEGYYKADVIEKVDGGYRHEKNISTITIDGTENINWRVGSGAEVEGSINMYAFVGTDTSIFDDAMPLFKSQKSNILCNKLVNRSQTEIMTNGQFGVSFYHASNGNDVISLRVSGIKTKSALNTWLQSNNITIQYILKTPVIESLSNANAKLLLSLKSYDEATFIGQTETVESKLELEYGSTNFATKALSGYVEAEQNAIRLTDLESAV